tara:strand:- start:2427 stop:3143 length:717 start_codon:yes stop_codon:yes gene_type:complete
MFGVLDIGAKFPLEDRIADAYDLEDNVFDNSDGDGHTWFCFLPARVYNKRLLRHGVLPRENKSQIIYRLPFPSVVTNPSEIRGYLDEIYLDALSIYVDRFHEGVSVLGVSLGNALAFRFANTVECDRLVSIVPGADVPYGISIGSATKHIYKEALDRGEYDMDAFRDALDIYSPEQNINNLPEDIEIHGGSMDRVVPYEQCERLVDKIEASGRHPRLVTRRWVGHTGAIALTHFRNKY